MQEQESNLSKVAAVIEALLVEMLEWQKSFDQQTKIVVSVNNDKKSIAGIYPAGMPKKLKQFFIKIKGFINKPDLISKAKALEIFPESLGFIIYFFTRLQFYNSISSLPEVIAKNLPDIKGFFLKILSKKLLDCSELPELEEIFFAVFDPNGLEQKLESFNQNDQFKLKYQLATPAYEKLKAISFYLLRYSWDNSAFKKVWSFLKLLLAPEDLKNAINTVYEGKPPGILLSKYIKKYNAYIDKRDNSSKNKQLKAKQTIGYTNADDIEESKAIIKALLEAGADLPCKDVYLKAVKEERELNFELLSIIFDCYPGFILKKNIPVGDNLKISMLAYLSINFYGILKVQSISAQLGCLRFVNNIAKEKPELLLTREYFLKGSFFWDTLLFSIIRTKKKTYFEFYVGLLKGKNISIPIEALFEAESGHSIIETILLDLEDPEKDVDDNLKAYFQSIIALHGGEIFKYRFNDGTTVLLNVMGMSYNAFSFLLERFVFYFPDENYAPYLFFQENGVAKDCFVYWNEIFARGNRQHKMVEFAERYFGFIEFMACAVPLNYPFRIEYQNIQTGETYLEYAGPHGSIWNKKAAPYIVDLVNKNDMDCFRLFLKYMPVEFWFVSVGGYLPAPLGYILQHQHQFKRVKMFGLFLYCYDNRLAVSLEQAHDGNWYVVLKTLGLCQYQYIFPLKLAEDNNIEKFRMGLQEMDSIPCGNITFFSLLCLENPLDAIYDVIGISEEPECGNQRLFTENSAQTFFSPTPPEPKNTSGLSFVIQNKLLPQKEIDEIKFKNKLKQVKNRLKQVKNDIQIHVQHEEKVNAAGLKTLYIPDLDITLNADAVIVRSVYNVEKDTVERKEFKIFPIAGSHQNSHFVLDINNIKKSPAQESDINDVLRRTPEKHLTFYKESNSCKILEASIEVTIFCKDRLPIKKFAEIEVKMTKAGRVLAVCFDAIDDTGKERTLYIGFVFESKGLHGSQDYKNHYTVELDLSDYAVLTDTPSRINTPNR